MSTFVESIRTCRVCGCTDAACSRCVARTGTPCWWVETDRGSACASRPGRIWRLAARTGLRRRLQARALEGGR